MVFKGHQIRKILRRITGNTATLTKRDFQKKEGAVSERANQTKKKVFKGPPLCPKKAPFSKKRGQIDKET